jgi:putative SOS response-associated peptidase YedK
MCGRFSLWADKNKIVEHYDLKSGPDTYTGYNVTPSYDIPVIRLHNGRELANCHWGLIPHWAKDTKLQPANARADGVATKPYFRDSFRYRRCLIPVNGYYEWSEVGGKKQPYFIHMENNKLFSLAGIWSRWESPDKTIESCAIITTEPNSYLAKIHDRMPLIIRPADYDRWLEQGGMDMLTPYTGEMEAYPVSTRVNSPKNQGPDLIQPI